MVEPDVKSMNQTRKHSIGDGYRISPVGAVLGLDHDGVVLVHHQIASDEEAVQLLQLGVVALGLVTVG